MCELAANAPSSSWAKNLPAAGAPEACLEMLQKKEYLFFPDPEALNRTVTVFDSMQ